MNCVRILAGLLFIAWLLTLAPGIESLFGSDGWFDKEGYREAARLKEYYEKTRLPGAPSVRMWSLLDVFGSDPALLQGFYWASIAVFVLFTLGLWTRLTAVLTWLSVVSFLGNPATRYDGDYLLALLAFYLMIGYVFLGQWSRPQTFLSRLLGSRDTFLLGRFKEDRPSHAANLAVRLLQVNFAIMIVISGLHKLQYGDWWSGAALWYPLHPPFETDAESLVSRPEARAYLVFLSVVQYVVLAWQIGFPLFAWWKRWRVVLLGGGVAGWIGSLFIWQLPLFGPAMLIGCLSYVTPEEWLWAAALIPRKAEARDQRSEVRDQRSEVRSQRSEVRIQKSQ
jgi:hypothetical protein